MIQNQSKELPSVVAKELSLLALDSENDQADDLINKYCEEAIMRLPEEAEVVRRGNLRVLNKLVGYVMKMSKGRADAQAVHARLKGMLVEKD